MPGTGKRIEPVSRTSKDGESSTGYIRLDRILPRH